MISNTVYQSLRLLYSTYTTMKINTIALVISSVASAQPTKQCIICKNGITTPSFMPRADIGDTSTCKQIVEGAAMFDTDSDMCQASLLGVEDVCCPSNPCTFCVDKDTSETQTDETGCEELLELATLFELESKVCSELKKAEMTCCPEAEDELLDEEDKLFGEDTSVERPPDSQPSVPLVNPIVSEIQSSNPSSASSIISSALVMSSAVVFVFVLMM